MSRRMLSKKQLKNLIKDGVNIEVVTALLEGSDTINVGLNEDGDKIQFRTNKHSTLVKGYFYVNVSTEEAELNWEMPFDFIVPEETTEDGDTSEWSKSIDDYVQEYLEDYRTFGCLEGAENYPWSLTFKVIDFSAETHNGLAEGFGLAYGSVTSFNAIKQLIEDAYFEFETTEYIPLG